MFDIRDYYRDQKNPFDEDTSGSIGELEEDISHDIDNILRNRFDSPYLKDRFKHGHSVVEIIYPRISYQGGRSAMKGPDYVRSMLSLYPSKSDIENVEKIVLRPRHVEFADIELMALYLRRRRILVFYLHHPHVYPLTSARFMQYAELVPGTAAGALSGPDGRKGAEKPEHGMPPLWYVLSMISPSSDASIDKFFVRTNPHNQGETTRLIREISYYYSRHGY